jgi:hypothetical protein
MKQIGVAWWYEASAAAHLRNSAKKTEKGEGKDCPIVCGSKAGEVL